MDVLLVGPRGCGEREREQAAAVTALAAALVRGGDRVRLLRPVEPRAAKRADGEPVEPWTREVPSRTPPFRSVMSGQIDSPLELALSRELRDDPADVVHVQGYGAANSYLLAWFAERLGVPSVVVVDPIEAVLCHRGTLVDREGQPCRQFDDARRCARCCRGADPAALGRTGAALAVLTRPLRGLAPFPSETAMLNRLDTLIHGLAAARLVCVRDPAAATDLIALGLPEKLLHVGIPGPDVALWRAIWARAST